MPYIPKQHFDQTTRRNNGSVAVDIVKSTEEEQRIANAFITDKIEMKDTSLSRLTGLKTTVIYYQQKLTNRSNYIVNVSNLSSIDPNKSQFMEIKDFVIICQDEISQDFDNAADSQEHAGMTATASAKILPKTIKPNAGDYFVMITLENMNLYRVTSAQRTTMGQDSAYEIRYQLIEENADEQLDELKRLVPSDEHYKFVWSNIGTEFRTIFKRDEYGVLEKYSEMYYRLAEIYNEQFYNEEKNTYVLKFDATDIKDERGIPLCESRIANCPGFTMAKVYTDMKNPTQASVRAKNLISPRLNGSDVWYGSLMYDRMLCEFVTKNNLFKRVDRKIYRITNLLKDLEKFYSKTVWYALEKQTTSNLRFVSMLPAPVTRVNMSTPLALYGLVNLEPLAVSMDGALDLYPVELIPYMKWENIDKNRSLENIKLNKYSDMIELICETIGLYVNKKEEYIKDRLLLMHSKLDEFFDLSIRDQNTFYLFPMLAYVIQKAADRISSADFALSVRGSMI